MAAAYDGQHGVGLLSPMSGCMSEFCFFFSSRRRHTRFDCDWSSDVCSSDLAAPAPSPNSDTMTSVLDYQDRATCVLFGDGAGAALLESAGPNEGILDFEHDVDGDRKSVV